MRRRSSTAEIGDEWSGSLIITRPPIAQDRLERRQDGRLELIFKKVWRDGTRALVLEPHDLIARLVAAVPPPRFHMLRYFGCSRATHRAGPSSCPSRPWMRPVTSHLRLEAISSSCSARRTMRRSGGSGGRGCWRTCSRPMSRRARVAPAR
ncbi:MAG: transposase [Myxococcales bacterium]|nr:transposase [Myxococcales bacterium]